MWQPAVQGEPDDQEFIARCLLDPGVVGATRRLSMLDLRVWAALIGQLSEQYRNAPPDDLDRASARTVQTTGYQLRDAVYGRRRGHQSRSIRQALVRLGGTRACVRVIEADSSWQSSMSAIAMRFWSVESSATGQTVDGDLRGPRGPGGDRLVDGARMMSQAKAARR